MDTTPYLSELHQLIHALCRIPAPSGREDARAEFCRAWFESSGFSGVTVDDAKNVVCPVQGTFSGPSVLFLAHTDTVFPDTEPFDVVSREGRWYCPGIGDNTVNLALMMMAAKILKQQGKIPREDLLFAADSGEEGLGNLKGCRALMDRYGETLKEVVAFDLSYRYLYVKAVGSARYRITVKTQGGHSYGDFGTPNAIHQLSRLVCALYEQALPEEGDCKTTFNVGTVQGGTSVNTIAQQGEILYEYRSDSNECMSVMEKQLQTILSDFRREGMDLICESIGVRPGMSPSRDPERQAALIERAETVIREVTGITPFKESASTDCNIPLSMGIPSICFGLADGGGAHTREEWIDPESLPKGLELALRFLGGYYE